MRNSSLCSTLKEFVHSYRYLVLLLLILGVHILGLFGDIFNGDSALYASISKNMASSREYFILNAIVQPNWIDKPHFAFWIWSFFIQIFGNTSFAFKLPSFLAFLILLRYVYLFSLKYYEKKIAWTAIIILSSSLHIFIATNDVRIDLFLVCFMMAAIYHYQSYFLENSLFHIIVASCYACMAVMTKGIYVIIPILVSILIPILQQLRSYKIIWWHWILSASIFIVGISPALYALKVQFANFDNSPILGQKASNYLQFFFWDSQFGRFQSNLGQVQSTGDPSFYIHTLLWAFAPWSLLLPLFFLIKKNILKEYVALSCFIVLIVVLSISKTQLSHHCLILLPFLSVLTAVVFRANFWRVQNRFFEYFLCIIVLIVLVVSIYCTKLVFGSIWHSYMILPLAILSIILIWSYINKIDRILICLLSISLYIGLYIQLIFYPEILRYQSGKNLATCSSKYSVIDELHNFFGNISLFNYYGNKKIVNIQGISDLVKGKKYLVYTGEYGLSEIKKSNIKYRIICQSFDYRTTVLTSRFLDKSKRREVVETYYLIEINLL